VLRDHVRLPSVPVSRARRNFTEGLLSDNPWKMSLGVALGLAGVLRKARHPEPEVVDRVVLRPGQTLLISTREPEPSGRRARATRKTRAAKGRRRK